jgi:hypothetical protein
MVRLGFDTRYLGAVDPSCRRHLQHLWWAMDEALGVRKECSEEDGPAGLDARRRAYIMKANGSEEVDPSVVVLIIVRDRPLDRRLVRRAGRSRDARAAAGRV